MKNVTKILMVISILLFCFLGISKSSLYNTYAEGNEKFHIETERYRKTDCYNAYVGFNSSFLCMDSEGELYSEESLKWSTSNTDIVDISWIDYQSWVSFLSIGEATITVTSDTGESASINVIVNEKPTLELNKPQLAHMDYEGEVMVYKFVAPENGGYRFYSSGDLTSFTEAVLYDAEYDEIVESENPDNSYCFELTYNLEAGKTYYLTTQYYYIDVIGDYNVGVEKIDTATSVELIYGDSYLGYVGTEDTFEYTLYPEGCAHENIKLTSSNEKIAYISGNEVCFESEGTVVITATTDSGLTDSIQVKVVKSPEIFLNDKKEVNVKTPWESVGFLFNPPKTGTYIIHITEGSAPGISLRCESGWGSNYDYLSESRSELHYKTSFDEGDTAYINTHMNSDFDGTYYVEVERVLNVEKIEIEQYPEKINYYKEYCDYNYEGMRLKATMDDGSVVYSDFLYSSFDSIGEWEVSIDEQFDEKTGEYSHIVIECNDKTTEFDFNVIENPVESISVESGAMPDLIENVDGYNDYFTGEFEYSFFDEIRDMKFRINYKDGTSKVVTVDDEIDGYMVDAIADVQSWKLGSDNYVSVSYLGIETQVPVTIVENPVEYITIDVAPTRKYEWGDVKIGSLYDNIYYFDAEDFTGMVFTLHYKDGTTKSFTSEDINNNEFYAYVDGRPFYVYSGIEANSPGKYEVAIEYMGHLVEYDIEVVKSDVASIEVVKDPIRTIIGNLFMADYLGMQLKINYIDGSFEIVEASRDNTTFDFIGKNIMGCFIDYDNSAFLIEEYYDFDSEYSFDGSTYVITYKGATCYYDNFTYEESKEISSVDFNNIVTMDPRKMSIVVNYANGEKETARVTDVLQENIEDGYFSGYLITEKGMTYCDIRHYTDEEDNSSKYSVEIFNDWFDVTPNGDGNESQFLLGDVDGNNVINAADALAILKHAAKIHTLEESVQQAANVEKDELINAADALKILKYAARIIDSLE